MHKPFLLGNVLISLIGIRYIERNRPYRITGSKDYSITVAYKGDKVHTYFDTELEQTIAFNQIQDHLIKKVG